MWGGEELTQMLMSTFGSNTWVLWTMVCCFVLMFDVCDWRAAVWSFSPEAVLGGQIILTAWDTDVSIKIHIQKHSANYTLRNDAVKKKMHQCIFSFCLAKYFVYIYDGLHFALNHVNEQSAFLFLFKGHIILMLSCCCCFTDVTWDNRKCWIRKWAQGSFTDRMALFTLKEIQWGHRVCERLPMPDHISATCCPLHASRARD